MDFKKLTNSEMNMEINNEKITNNTFMEKASNYPNMNLSNNNINSSNLSMREKLKNPSGIQNQIEKKFNDSEKDVISPSDILLESNFKEKESKLQENIKEKNPLNIEQCQQITNENIENLHKNSYQKNSEDKEKEAQNPDIKSTYSIHTNEINITNSINEFQKPENYLNNSNLNCSIEKEKGIKEANFNTNAPNNSVINNRNNFSELSGIKENSKINNTDFNFNNINNLNKSSSRNVKERESFNPHIRNEIIFPEDIIKKKEEENSNKEKTLNFNFNSEKESNLNIPNMHINNKSHMPSELEIDEKEIVLLNENFYNENFTPFENTEKSKGNIKEKEKELLIPNETASNLKSDRDKYFEINPDSIYEDARSEQENINSNPNINNNIPIHGNQDYVVNAPVPSANAAYGNYVIKKNQGDESSIMNETEISIYSNEKYFTLKKNNKFSDLNCNYIYNNINTNTNPNKNLNLNFETSENNLNTNTYSNQLNTDRNYIPTDQKSEIFSQQEKSVDQSSVLINKNPVSGAYFHNNNNQYLTSSNNNNLYDLKSQISDIQSRKFSLNRDDPFGKSGLEFNFNPNENVEKNKYTEEPNRSSFFSPTAHTPLYLKENKHNYDFQNFNLNEEEANTNTPENLNTNSNQKNVEKLNENLSSNFNLNNNSKSNNKIPEYSQENIQNKSLSNKINNINNDINKNTNKNLNINTYKNELNENDLFNDMDEFNKNNFKNLLETENSKIEKSQITQNNLTQNNLNPNYDIQGDNSKLNFTVTSENKRHESDITNTNINPYRRDTNKNNKSAISNIEDRKIQTIFEKINADCDVGTSTNTNPNTIKDKEINTKQLNNTANNINIKDIKQLVNENNPTGNFNTNANNNTNNIIINQANITNSYNININNENNTNNTNKEFQINQDQLIELDESAIIKNKNPNMISKIEEKDFITNDNENNGFNFLETNENKENIERPQILMPSNSEINTNSDKISKEFSEITYRVKDPEKVKDDKESEINNISITNSKRLEALKKIEEPENDQNIFEESLLNEEKKEYILIKNSNESINFDNEILSKIYGINFIRDWRQKSSTKIAYHVKASEESEIKYFENNVMIQKDFVNELPDFISDYDKSLNEFDKEVRKHIEDYDKEKDLKNTNINLFKDINEANNDYKQKQKDIINLLNSNQSKNTFNKISYLYNIEILELKYKLNNNVIDIDKELSNPFKDIMTDKEIDKDSKIACWRESLCDGNSFYRMFMFSLIENFIFKKNFLELAKLFKKIEKDYKELSKFNDNFKAENKLVIERIFKNININNVLLIFNEILNNFKKERYLKAYNNVINAFNLKDESFDKIMIEYLRLNIYKQLIRAESTFEKKMKQGKTSSYEQLNLRSHAYEFIAPNKIHFDILVKIFKLNISLYYFDGSINKNNKKKITSGKENFYYSKDYSTPTFKFFYNLNHYSKYYEEKELMKNQEFLFNPLMELKNTLSYDDKYICKCCNNKENTLIFFLRQGYKICKNCLMNICDKVLFERAKNLDQENYISREFYCKPIVINNCLVVNDFDYISIFKKNFWNTMVKQIRELCNRCLKQYPDILKNINNYRYCKYCTNELYRLGIGLMAPKAILGKSPIVDKDNYIKDEIDYSQKFDLIKTSKEQGYNIDNDFKEEHERLKNLLINYCCICVKNKKKNIIQANDPSNLKFFDFKLDNVIEDKHFNFYKNRIICSTCMGKFDKKKLGLDENDQNMNIKKDIRVSFFCNICRMELNTVLRADKRKGKNEGGCCNNGCSIF